MTDSGRRMRQSALLRTAGSRSCQTQADAEGFRKGTHSTLSVEMICFIVKWKLKGRRRGVDMIPRVSCYDLGLASQGMEASLSSFLCCFYSIYKLWLHVVTVFC